jgi:hypothetical protein
VAQEDLLVAAAALLGGIGLAQLVVGLDVDVRAARNGAQVRVGGRVEGVDGVPGRLGFGARAVSARRRWVVSRGNGVAAARARA